VNDKDMISVNVGKIPWGSKSCVEVSATKTYFVGSGGNILRVLDKNTGGIESLEEHTSQIQGLKLVDTAKNLLLSWSCDEMMEVGNVVLTSFLSAPRSISIPFPALHADTNHHNFGVIAVCGREGVGIIRPPKDDQEVRCEGEAIDRFGVFQLSFNASGEVLVVGHTDPTNHTNIFETFSLDPTTLQLSSLRSVEGEVNSICLPVPPNLSLVLDVGTSSTRMLTYYNDSKSWISDHNLTVQPLDGHLSGLSRNTAPSCSCFTTTHYFCIFPSPSSPHLILLAFPIETQEPWVTIYSTHFIPFSHTPISLACSIIQATDSARNVDTNIDITAALSISDDEQSAKLMTFYIPLKDIDLSTTQLNDFGPNSSSFTKF